MKTAYLPVVILCPSHTRYDCAVAALAMYVGCAYAEAALAYGDARILRTGAWRTQIVAAAERLGVALVSRKTWDADHADGIAQVRLPRSRENHVALIRAGLLWDGDLTVWEPDEYVRARGGTWGWLLTRREP